MPKLSKSAAIVLIASSIATTALISRTGMANAADPASGETTQVARKETDARDSKHETKNPSTTGNRARSRKRGRIQKLISYCDVDPPCPAGCKIAESGNVCVEKAGR